MSIIKITIAIVKESKMSRIIPNHKQVMISWQPRAASRFLIAITNFKTEFLEGLIKGDEVFFTLFLVCLVICFRSLNDVSAVPNLHKVVGLNG